MLEHQPELRPEKFRVWVEDVVTSTPLKEYSRKACNGFVQCYIASENERLFSVHVDLNDTTECLSCELYIDGQWVRSSFFGKTDIMQDTYRSFTIAEIDGGPGQSIPLRFGRAQTSGKIILILFVQWLINCR